MKRYDYRKEMQNDIKEWILVNHLYDSEKTFEEMFEEFYDDFFTEDCITGNGVMGCYDTEEHCEEYVCHNLSLYFEAAREYYDFPTGVTPWTWEGPAQHMDCTIRCYLLGECLGAALTELKEQYEGQ